MSVHVYEQPESNILEVSASRQLTHRYYERAQLPEARRWLETSQQAQSA